MPSVSQFTFEDIAKRLAKQRIKCFPPFVSVSQPMALQCMDCKHKWSAPIRQFHKYKRPCPACSKAASRVQTKESDVDATLAAKGIQRLDAFTVVAKTCRVKCLACNNVWSPQIRAVLGAAGCPNGCHTGVKNRKWSDAEYRAKVKELHPNIRLQTPFAGMLANVTARCNTHKVEFQTLARNFIRGTGCPECAKFAKFFHAEGKTVLMRGREPQALSWILKSTKFKMADVTLQPPYIKYVYKGKAHRYHPDFLIDGRIVVEVKSLESAGLGGHFYYKSDELFDLLKAKAAAVREQGYEFRLLVMAADGTKINMPKNWYLLTKANVMKKIQGLLPQWKSKQSIRLLRPDELSKGRVTCCVR